MQKITLFVCLLSMVGCRSVQQSKETDVTDFPAKPNLTQYATQPVIEKVGDNYLVTKDMVTNSIILIDYYKRLEVWKEKKNIR